MSIFAAGTMPTFAAGTMPTFASGEVIAIIPARGSSKGIPRKNLATVGGQPLVARAVQAAIAAGIGSVWVSTDDAAIADAARVAGASIIDRPSELAGDTATSESALLHVLDQLADSGLAPDVVAFLQATSPFIDPAALRRATNRVLNDEADSVFAAYETHAFLWQRDADGFATGVNHDARVRPRRQDREPQFTETGSFYVMRRSGFAEYRHRFFGRTAIEVVDEAHAIDIDSPAELATARRLAPETAKQDAIDVDALITDFDGVHTDDTATVTTSGEEGVRVSRADGMGVELLRDAGVPMLVLSKERNAVVATRAAKLRIPVLHGVDDKASAVRRWCAEQHLDPARVAYVGNDVNDLGALHAVGWPIAVADAHPEVLALARVVLHRRGGHGAVREVAELVLAAHAEREQKR